MADRPIIFSGPMIMALLQGRKTMTRRILNPAPRVEHFASEALEDFELRGFEAVEQPDGRHLVYRPGWRAGDRLWVREAHYLTDDGDEQFAVYACEDDDVREHLARIDGLPAYFSDEIKAAHRKLRPSIHMPRWASRLTLMVTEVRVQRLQDISEEDAIAEGVANAMRPDGSMVWMPPAGFGATRIEDSARFAFCEIWRTIHGPEAWAANPWVAAISFRATPANIDTLPEQAGGRT